MNQTTFPFSSGNDYDPNEYIESSSNKAAYNALMHWPEFAGVEPYARVLIIEGAKSSGKTFLARRWAAKSGALFIKKMHELTENIIANHSAFIIDDFDESWEEEKLLHHFNIIHEHSKYLLITTRKLHEASLRETSLRERSLHEASLPEIKLPDLSSRLNASNKISIELPDDELLKILIFKLFSNRSVVIGADVVEYLIKNLAREFQVIINSAEAINKFALENKRKITIPLVKQVLLAEKIQIA
ncbi:MAG: hypothetical protein COA94_00770 [Rickettsiales bacterium]|nr:MAG: hypothetical protein COA94_00770 [Rickettsiales bacterium]